MKFIFKLSFYINIALDIYKAKLLQENGYFMQGNVPLKKPDSPKFNVLVTLMIIFEKYPYFSIIG